MKGTRRREVHKGVLLVECFQEDDVLEFQSGKNAPDKSVAKSRARCSDPEQLSCAQEQTRQKDQMREGVHEMIRRIIGARFNM